jgi:hypothetical protein
MPLRLTFTGLMLYLPQEKPEEAAEPRPFPDLPSEIEIGLETNRHGPE